MLFSKFGISGIPGGFGGWCLTIVLQILPIPPFWAPHTPAWLLEALRSNSCHKKTRHQVSKQHPKLAVEWYTLKIIQWKWRFNEDEGSEKDTPLENWTAKGTWKSPKIEKEKSSEPNLHLHLGVPCIGKIYILLWNMMDSITLVLEVSWIGVPSIAGCPSQSHYSPHWGKISSTYKHTHTHTTYPYTSLVSHHIFPLPNYPGEVSSFRTNGRQLFSSLPLYRKTHR